MPVNDLELIAYVMGDASPDTATAIERNAAVDPELAAEIAILRSLGGGTATPPPRRKRFRKLRTAALIVAALVATGGAAYAGYVLTRTPPLLADDFETNTIAYSKWDINLGRKGTRTEKGVLRLLNRGSVVSKAEFDGPLEITFDWRWIDLGERPQYAETMTVALNTSGVHDENHAFEIRDGILVEFNAVNHSVQIGYTHGRGTIRTPPDTTPFPAEVWHHIRIVDDGERISVFVTGPAIDTRFEKEPALSVPVTDRPAHRHLAFFNRESLASTNHESQIDNVVVRRFVPAR